MRIGVPRVAGKKCSNINLKIVIRLADIRKDVISSLELSQIWPKRPQRRNKKEDEKLRHSQITTYMVVSKWHHQQYAGLYIIRKWFNWSDILVVSSGLLFTTVNKISVPIRCESVGKILLKSGKWSSNSRHSACEWQQRRWRWLGTAKHTATEWARRW